MKLVDRWGLPLLGTLLFLAAWQLVVVATRPAPRLRPALALSASDRGAVAAAVLDREGHVVASETIAASPDARADATAKLRLWVGSLQPTVAAIAPGDRDGRAAIEEAKRSFGGGLEIQEIAVSAAKDPPTEALARARAVQARTLMRATWLPNPLDALVALADMVKSGEMARHVVASLFRVVTGFSIATALGVPFGLALGTFARLHATTNTVIQCLRPISPIAWLPVATLALGGGDLAAIFLIFLSSFFPIAVATAAAVATVDSKYRRSALNFGVEGLAAAREVILPASLPAILTSLRIALGISWVVVVAAEMLGVESGLGYLVLDARNQLRYDRVVAAMIVIGLIGLLLDHVVRRFEQAELERRGLAT